MWDRLISRERDRRLGVLFGGALVAWCFYGVLADRAPMAAQIVAAACGTILFAMGIRWVWISRSRKPGPAPVGKLSSDERVKARAKLKNNTQRQKLPCGELGIRN